MNIRERWQISINNLHVQCEWAVILYIMTYQTLAIECTSLAPSTWIIKAKLYKATSALARVYLSMYMKVAFVVVGGCWLYLKTPAEEPVSICQLNTLGPLGPLPNDMWN